MAERRATEGQAKAALSAFNQRQWQEVIALLDSGRYRDAATLLKKSEASASANGNHALAAVLNATRQICLAGKDFHTEVNHHRHAYTVATKREKQLREHLQVILNILAGRAPGIEKGVTTSSAASSLSDHEQQIPGILKRLQSLLGWSDKTNASHAYPLKPSGADHEPEQPEKSRPLTAPTSTGYKNALALPPHGPSPQPDGHPIDHRPSLAIYCLGPFAVHQNDTLITEWDGLKGLSILKYMISQRGKPIPKEMLMEVVWPDADPESARRNLHQAMYSLRQTLRQAEPDFQHITFHNDSYRFNPEMKLWIDFVQFENYVKEGERLEANGNEREALRAFAIAEEFYQGKFLEEDPYEEWALGQREHLQSLYLKIVDWLTEHYLRQMEYAAATALCHKALAQDSCYELAHRRLMKCHIAQGQRHLAVRQYHACVRLLHEELDLEPSSETESVYHRIISSN